MSDEFLIVRESLLFTLIQGITNMINIYNSYLNKIDNLETNFLIYFSLTFYNLASK